MKANELMIGDWYQWYADGKYYYYQVNKDTFKNDDDTIASFEPIPLTSEILEKNDFVANKRVYPYPYYEYIDEKDKLKIGFAFPQGNRTSYKEPWVYIDSEYVFIEHLPCIHIHELQHVLKLCGIEKEIKL